MISRLCSPAEFTEAVKEKDYPEIIRLAEQELREARNLPWRGVDKGKRECIIAYGTFLRSFLFFMRGSGIRPSSLSDEDFQLLRPVCERLVQKGQFIPEIIDFFNHP